MPWYNQKEKGTIFLLKITFYLVKFSPSFLLKPIIFFISLIYFALSKDERNNIENFYKNLKYDNLNLKIIFSNFYNFSLSITDKIAVWIGKIKFEDIVLENETNLLEKLVLPKNGSIIIASHFGNVEIARALSDKKHNVKLAILAHTKNMLKFNSLINKISSKKIEIFEVKDLDIEKMIKLDNFLQTGGHLCIMADRVPIDSNRILRVNFLGKDALFPTGAFDLAYLLKCPVNLLWCIKKDGIYHVKVDEISKKIEKKDIRPNLEKYVKLLEQNCKKFPSMWFNFYDFWSKDDKKSL